MLTSMDISLIPGPIPNFSKLGMGLWMKLKPHSMIISLTSLDFCKNFVRSISRQALVEEMGLPGRERGNRSNSNDSIARSLSLLTC